MTPSLRSFFGLALTLVVCLLATTTVAQEAFTTQRHSVGNEEVCRLRSPNGELEAQIITSCGANVIALRRNGKPLLLEPQSPALVRRYPLASGIPVMFPFVCDIEGPEFTWEGRKITLKRNGGGEPRRSHGLLYRRPFKIQQLTGDRNGARLHCSFDSADDPELQREFPFQWRLEILFTLGKNALEVEWVVRNTSKSGTFPFGGGVHPYFLRKPGENPRFTAMTRLDYANGLSQGIRQDYTSPVITENALLTDITRDADGLARAQLGELTLEFDSGFPYLMSYYPKDNPESVSLELFAARPGAFGLPHDQRLAAGVIAIPPGGTHRLKFAVRWKD